MATLTYPFIGIVRGCDARTPENTSFRTRLRETKLHWVTPRGTKYRKTFGAQPGEDWPMYRLDLESIKPYEG